MKVLLIEPQEVIDDSRSVVFSRYPPYIPLGLGYLAAVLEQDAIEVGIWDRRIQVKPPIDLSGANIIGITCNSFDYGIVRHMIEEINGINSEALVVMGGSHPSVRDKQTLLENPGVSAIVRGEGELTFLELIHAIEKGKPLDGIAGLTFREGNKVKINPDRELIEDLDTVPFPARHLLDIDAYKKRNELYEGVITSRGCVYRCLFCAGSPYWKHRIRYRTEENVVAELGEVVNRYKSKKVQVLDHNFTINVKRAMKICSLIIQSGLDFEWYASSRVDTVKKDLLLSMARAGCKSISFGFESGCQLMLDRMQKGIRVQQIKEAVALCKECGIMPIGNFIMGLPWDTESTIQKTLELVSYLGKQGVKFAFSFLQPLPGSAFGDKPEKFDLRVIQPDYSSWTPTKPLVETKFLSERDLVKICFDMVTASVSGKKLEENDEPNGLCLSCEYVGMCYVKT